MLEQLQARADGASSFVNSIFATLWAVAGFGAGLAWGGEGKQYAVAILAGLFGFFFLRFFVALLRFAIMLAIIAAIAWAAWFLWLHVMASRPNAP